MIVFVESKSHYEKLNLSFDNAIYNGGLKYSFGLLDIKKATLVVVTLQHSFISSYMCELARKHRIEVWLVVDGIFEWNNSYNNPSLNGKHLFLHDNYDKVFICSDDDTLNYLSNFYSEVVKFKNKKVLGDKKNSDFMMSNKCSVLITTANTAYFNESEKTRLIDLLKMLKLEIEKNGIAYKTRIFDTSILEEVGFDDKKNEINNDFNSCCSDVRSVITTPSSISIEAMMLGKRVCHLSYRDTPASIQTAWVLHKSVDFTACLDSLIKEDKSERDIYQHSILSQYAEGISSFDFLDRAESIVSKPQTYSFIERLDFIWRLPYEILVKNNGFIRKIVK